MNFDYDELTARLRLARSENVGPITFRHLLARFGGAAAALDALPGLVRRGRGGRPARIPSIDEARREIDQVTEAGAEIIILGSEAYPEMLAAVEDTPPVLIAKGRIDLMQGQCIGMVGARNASAVGSKMSHTLAFDLSRDGFVIASGLARGIDTAAHGGSLENGTIAVLGGGVDVVYPRENAELQAMIAEQGLLLSEHPMGTKPQASHFPRRNRIISGLSLGIIVIEAAMRSGSLITARLAAEQGREVFAVPGSPMDPRARGTNNLIRQGATLIESADEVADALRSMNSIPLAEAPAFDFTPPAYDDLSVELDGTPISAANGDEQSVIQEKLSPVPIHIDDIVRGCALPTAAVMTILLELELAGIARRHPGNQVSLA